MHTQIELVIKITRYREFIEDVIDNKEQAERFIYGIETGGYTNYKNRKEDEEE